MENNRPRSREKHVTNNGTGIYRRGEGLSGAKGSGAPKRSSGGPVRSGSKLGLLAIIILLAIKFGPSLLGGLESSGTSTGSALLGQLVEIGQTYVAGNAIGTTVETADANGTSNAGVLNTSVANGAREKYTSILGKGADQVTIMVYLCGTDLESKYGMATNDVTEMAKATLNSQVNVILYTGGCSGWKNKNFSNSTNQIWRIANGGIECLVSDDGNRSMTKAETLTDFINYCDKNYPANRRELILWDHGGGSITGYGMDERAGHSGSLTLASIDTALKNSGLTFDFIGFDACLMGTLENGLMLQKYADYLIASEETEPGIGWYYTDWLTALAKNPSMPTVEIGKNIIDDYVSECNRSANGQKTTLSIVDLAELSTVIPEKLTAFASSLNNKMEADGYKEVSDARYQTKEFGVSCKVDQVDLVHFAKNTASYQGADLADALLSCVKYNRTSSNMGDSYGISIYFPYRKASNVGTAVSAYNNLGMDEEYTKCISSFAKIEVSGQSSSQGTNSATSILLGGNYSDNGLSALSSILGALSGRGISDTQATAYATKTQFDSSVLTWKEIGGHKVISMSEKQWSLVHDIAINMFYDDGTGYIDLGLDNLFSFDDQGNLIGDEEPTWLAIDGQPVAYYYEETQESGDQYTITGYVPALLNGEKVNLILQFDNAHPEGYIAGARPAYDESVTETVAKSMITLYEGDKLDFLCNYYAYDGTFIDSYYLGEQMKLSKSPVISNVPVKGTTKITYRFTDIYNQTYWTPVLE